MIGPDIPDCSASCQKGQAGATSAKPDQTPIRLSTHPGLEEKTRIAQAFDKRKEAEFEVSGELEALKGELAFPKAGEVMAVPFPPLPASERGLLFVIQSWDMLPQYPNKTSKSES